MGGGVIVGSLCSGAGFMDLGFHRAGHQTAWFCEADSYRRRVLARHWPGVPIYPDLCELDPADLEPVDILIGGTPCPAWSSAGRRAGFNDPRAKLYWHFVRIRDAIRPQWTVWENVPGVFSQHGGRDFALVLEALVGARVAVPSGGWAGAGVASGPVGTAAWRLLNAQWFGVPQRRRRVFVVADLGGVRAEQVLFEREGGGGDSAQGCEAGTPAAAAFGVSVAGALGAHKSGGTDPTDLERGGASSSDRRSLGQTGGGASMTTMHEPDTLLSLPRSVEAATRDQARQGDDGRTTRTLSLMPSDPRATTPARTAPDDSPRSSSKIDTHTHTQSVAHSRAEADDLTETQTPLSFHATQTPVSDPDVAPALGRKAQIGVLIDGLSPALRAASGGGSKQYVSVAENQRAELREADVSPALSRGGGKPGSGYSAVRNGQVIRRLTPTERERLMGAPDGWTYPFGPSLADAPNVYPSEDRAPVDVLPDGPREAASGDGVAVPVAEWVGERLRRVLHGQEGG